MLEHYDRAVKPFRFQAASMRLIMIALTCLGLTLEAAAFERVDISAQGTSLNAILLRPSRAGPIPAIVALHGCSGLVTRDGALRAIYRDWGERWVAAGYAVLFPDSFSSRRAGSQCTIRERTIRPRVERRTDALAAKEWLQTQPWADPTHIFFLVGWSHGGSTTLWSIAAGPQPQNSDFRAAVAFYPGCRLPAQRGWSARVPTLILIGEADDWTPASPCHELVRQARERSAKLDLVTYPGAHHAFDHPHLALRQRTGLAFTADGSGKAHIGTNPAARADAIKRVTDWFTR